MAKPIKPEWAYGDPSFIIEPSAGKKSTGWQSGEKPPFQYMNWIHFQNNEWIDYLENKAETNSPTFIRSDSTLSWSGSALTFTQPIDISFRVTTGEQINRILAADSPIALADGEVLIINKDKTNSSPVNITAQAYGSLTAGHYSIVAEASLTAVDHENQLIIFRRRGTNLEIVPNNAIYTTGSTITIGQVVAAAGVTDHGVLSGLADDDHSQYSRVDGTRAFTGVVSGVTPTAAAHLTRKDYVDGLIAPTRLLSFWADVLISGTVNASYNIAGVSHDATGVFTVTIDVDLANANYAVTGNPVTVSGDTDSDEFITFSNKTVGSFNLRIENSTSGSEDQDFTIIGAGGV